MSSGTIIRVVTSDRKSLLKSLSQRLNTKKTSSRLRRPRTKKRRRPKQAAIEVIPVNEVPDVIGGDYDDYDIVDYIYEYDDIGPRPAAPVAAPPPPPPPPSQDRVIPVFGLHNHDKYSASPVLLHDHPPPNHHNQPHHKPGGYHVSVDTPSFRYNIEQYGEAPSYGHYEPPPQPSYGHYEPPPPPKYGHYEPPPPSYGHYERPPPPNYDHYKPPPPSYGHYEPPPPPQYGHYEPTYKYGHSEHHSPKYSHDAPPPPKYSHHEPPPTYDPYIPKYHEHQVLKHHGGPYRPKFGYPKPIPHQAYQAHHPYPPPQHDPYPPPPPPPVYHEPHPPVYNEPPQHPHSESLTIHGGVFVKILLIDYHN